MNYKKLAVPILTMLVVAGLAKNETSPTKTEREASFDAMLEHSKEMGICPEDADPIVMFTDRDGFEYPSQTFHEDEGWGTPSYIVMSHYENKLYLFDQTGLHEITHYCSLKRTEDLRDLDVNNIYGKLFFSRGKIPFFVDEKGRVSRIDVFEEAFAYYSEAENNPNPKDGWYYLGNYGHKSYQLALLAKHITEYYSIDYLNLGYRGLITAITGRELNAQDMDTLEGYFTAVKLGYMSAEQAMTDISNMYPVPTP